jgi:integrase
LGRIDAIEARRRARILAGHATVWMETMTKRETLTRTLSALAAELETLRRDEWRASFGVLNARTRMKEADEGWSGDANLIAHARLQEARGLAQRDAIRAFRERVEALRVASDHDSAAWEAERATYDHVVSTLATLERSVIPAQPMSFNHSSSVPPSPPPLEPDPQEFTRDTLFSVAAAPFLNGRREALESSGERSRYADRLEASFRAFIDIIGDKPLKSYLPADIQAFATVLGRVPANRTKLRAFTGMSLREMADANDRLKDPRPRLAETAVEGYVAEVRSIWRGATASVKDIRDLGSVSITMPRSAAPSVDREGLRPDKLNPWLVAAASRPLSEPHSRWLPLVGLMTGMRLGELVFLQGGDLVKVEDNLVIDLRRPIIINGRERRRPLKTKTSRRLVAVHQLLHDVGFVEWAMRKEGWLFDAFHTAKDPADAAQKRMAYWMKELGIHSWQSGVFHSLRHNTKAWLRIHIGDRNADLQCGHAPTGVGANYGFRILEPEEVQQIMQVPLPRGVDFSPYLNRKD